MKRILVITLVLACFSIAAYAQNANGCSSGQRLGIYYTDCWTDTGDDTTRLQSALNQAVEKLVFNETNYTVSDQLTIPPYRVLVGTSPSSGYTTAKITLVNGAGSYRSPSLFKIASCTMNVVIRDLALVNAVTGSSLTTTGILAQGENSACSGAGASINSEFNNLVINGFVKGIWVSPLNSDYGWQFDNVKMTHCTFENNVVGIEINSKNSGWHMSSSTFSTPADGYGIKIMRGGYIHMALLIGNGTKSGTSPYPPLSETFLYTNDSSNMTIQNIATEGFKKGIHLDGVDKSLPINLTGNITDVTIKNSTVVSTGNFWGNANYASNPQIIGRSDVVSIGDRFCISHAPYNQYCAGSGWSLVADSGYKPTLKTFNNHEESASRSLVRILYPDAGKVLLELGNYYDDTYQYTYKIIRDNNGWLSFEGSQADPYKGYKFNAPVSLSSYTYANLPTGATVADGTVAYCSNCTANTNPCSTSGGGGGALALMAGGSWRCK